MRGLRLAGVALALIVAGGLAPPLAHSDPVRGPQQRIPESTRLDSETDCVELTPDSLSITGLTDAGNTIGLDVLVLLDGVNRGAAGKLMAKSAASYAPLRIALRATYQVVSFSGTDAQGLIGQARAHLGGQRPAGVDVVHVLTAKDIELPGLGKAVAGLADCIGGVKDPKHAFAVAEANFPPPTNLVLQRGVDTASRVTAHEIGHLLGAHHHYANCVEGAASELNELSPCTLMFNTTNFGSANFSQLNGVMVRGHAVAYASP